MSENQPQRSKQHHTIPQFILRNFADAKGDIHEFDLDLLKRYRRKPRQVAHIPDFYTIDTSGGPSDVIEKAISRIESEASDVVRKLAMEGARLSSVEIDTLVLFVALQTQRVPIHRRNMTASVDRMAEMAYHVAVSHGVDPSVSNVELASELDFMRSRNFMNPFLLKSLLIVYRLMRNRGWAVLRRPTSAPRFVISDNPVVFTDLRQEHGPPYLPLLPYGEDSRITMPISPELVLVSYYEPERSGEAYLQPDLVGFFNYDQLRNSGRRLYSCENDLTWGRLGDRELRWKDYVTDQQAARAEAGWIAPYMIDDPPK